MPTHISKPQVLFFYAKWCGPSQPMGRVLERAVEAYKDQYLPIKYFDVDETEEALLAKHRCLGVPTTVLLGRQGKELARLVGYNTFEATCNFLRKGVL